MPTLSYFLSSVLLVSPFAIAAIIQATENDSMPDKTYGEWLALIFTFSLGIVILRILYKEITISDVIEASKKFKLGDASLQESEGGTSLIRGFINLIFTPGLVMSYFIFPRGENFPWLKRFGILIFIGLLCAFSYFTAEILL